MNTTVASKTGKTEHLVLVIMVMACSLLHACKKVDRPHPHLPPDPTGTRIGKLKEINAERIPSPWYHFEYTDQGVKTGIDFASGLFRYHLSYANGRLDRMTNAVNGYALVYNYKNGLVKLIRNTKPNGVVVLNYSFDYDALDQLKAVRYFETKNAGADTILHRKVTLAYYPDGNLKSYDDYRDANLSDTLAWTLRTEYADYDNGTNVYEDFSVFKDFFDQVLYLPGIRLQKNNPHKIFITTAVNDYDITDTYTYQNNKLVFKSEKFVQLKGANVGQTTVSGTSYSYY
jgi:hypothetical protein